MMNAGGACATIGRGPDLSFWMGHMGWFAAVGIVTIFRDVFRDEDFEGIDLLEGKDRFPIHC